MKINSNTMKIAIFASGGGSNAKAIVDYFNVLAAAPTFVFLTNKEEAGIYQVGKSLDIPVFYFDNQTFAEGVVIVELLKNENVKWVVLAGFLRKIHPAIIDAFPKKIVNIHPALLPSYGGKGMYGMNVHEAVFNAKESWSGMTIHYVNNNYDEGNVIFQDKVFIEGVESPKEVASRVLSLEHFHYPRIIHKLVQINNP